MADPDMMIPADIWACPHDCGNGPLVDILDSSNEWDGSSFLRFAMCCQQLQADVDVYGFEDAVGDIRHILELVDPQLADVRAVSDWDAYLVRRLQTRVLSGGPDQRMAFDFVRDHHRHHQAPVGWKFGVACFNGGALVGVGTIGRPVSRALQTQGHLEVTRVAAAGPYELRRNACSAIYAAAAREARRRGHVRELVTYTLDTEEGAALKAVGWLPQHRTNGGSWDCPSRRRADTAPTVPKVRWHAPLPHAQAS